MLPQFGDLSSNISNLLTALSCQYVQKLKIHFGNLSEAPSVLYTLCLLPIWDYSFVLKFPCRLIYLWTFFDSHLFGGQEYLVWKRRSNLAQFWFSKSMSEINRIFLIFFIEEYENGRITFIFVIFDNFDFFFVLYFLKMCTNFDLWHQIEPNPKYIFMVAFIRPCLFTT